MPTPRKRFRRYNRCLNIRSGERKRLKQECLEKSFAKCLGLGGMTRKGRLREFYSINQWLSADRVEGGPKNPKMLRTLYVKCPLTMERRRTHSTHAALLSLSLFRSLFRLTRSFFLQCAMASFATRLRGGQTAKDSHSIVPASQAHFGRKHPGRRVRGRGRADDAVVLRSRVGPGKATHSH